MKSSFKALSLSRKRLLRLAVSIGVVVAIGSGTQSSITGALQVSYFQHDRLMQAPNPGDEGQRNSNNTDYFQKYHEVLPQILSQLDKKRPGYLSAYSRATVVNQTTSWFSKRKICKETCCVETVAVSLDQDEHKIINFEDARDVADLLVQHDKYQPAVHANHLHEDMLPCLVPGTIIFIQHDHHGVRHFFNTLRPKIRVPFILVLSTTDSDMPGLSTPFLDDPLLMKIYGPNPRLRMSNIQHTAIHPKYQSISIGLSRSRKQEKFLEPYLEWNRYNNPFRDSQFKQQYNFTQRPLDFDKDVFVHFGVDGKAHREALWKIACNNRTSGANHSDASCNPNTKRLPVQEIYKAASQYRFGLSPTGWGWDCHRNYELLLLGVIPIVEDRPEGRDLFEGLPVIFLPNMVKNINSLTKQDFVDAINKYIGSDAFQKASFEHGWERLFLRYRRRQLLKDSGRDTEIVVDEHGREFYQAFQYTVTQPTPGDDPRDKIHCPITLEHCKPENIDSSWLQNPMPEMSQQDNEWLAAWKSDGAAVAASR